MIDQPKPEAAAETLYVENIDHFIALLFAWHENKIKTLEHMMSIPEGTEVSFSDEPPTMLSGDVLKGYQMGLALALIEVGTLPFMAEPVEPQNTDEPATAH